MTAIAHHAEHGSQLLSTHLRGVGALAKEFASKLRLAEQGELLGLLHDIGKYSDAFQAYIQSAIGVLEDHVCYCYS